MSQVICFVILVVQLACTCCSYDCHVNSICIISVEVPFIVNGHPQE